MNSSSITTSSIGDMSSTLPPPNTLHPLHVLEHYLDAQPQQQQSDEDAPATTTLGRKAAQDHHDEVLRVADFLYGTTLDGALSLLDNATTSITKVVSIPSQRSLHLVRGQGDNSYFCLFPDASQQSPNAIYYCSCRSFLEKSRNTHNTHHNDGATAAASSCLCKHLVALQLMPALAVQGSCMETVSDEEFAKLVLKRIGIP